MIIFVNSIDIMPGLSINVFNEIKQKTSDHMLRFISDQVDMDKFNEIAEKYDK
jgi:hypothetical protein